MKMFSDEVVQLMCRQPVSSDWLRKAKPVDIRNCLIVAAAWTYPWKEFINNVHASRKRTFLIQQLHVLQQKPVYLMHVVEFLIDPTIIGMDWKKVEKRIPKFNKLAKIIGGRVLTYLSLTTVIQRSFTVDPSLFNESSLDHLLDVYKSEIPESRVIEEFPTVPRLDTIFQNTDLPDVDINLSKLKHSVITDSIGRRHMAISDPAWPFPRNPVKCGNNLEGVCYLLWGPYTVNDILYIRHMEYIKERIGLSCLNTYYVALNGRYYVVTDDVIPVYRSTIVPTANGTWATDKEKVKTASIGDKLNVKLFRFVVCSRSWGSLCGNYTAYSGVDAPSTKFYDCVFSKLSLAYERYLQAQTKSIKRMLKTWYDIVVDNDQIPRWIRFRMCMRIAALMYSKNGMTGIILQSGNE